MSRRQWTEELALAAGKDAANARMRKRGATKWSRGDYNEAVRVTSRLLGCEHPAAVKAPS